MHIKSQLFKCINTKIKKKQDVEYNINKLGLSLRRRKKDFLDQKLTKFQKKKKEKPTKKQAETELKKEKGFFWPKIGENLIIRSRNCPILKKKKDFSVQKTSWG